MISLDGAMQTRIARAIDDLIPITVSYIETTGKPHIAFYGSTHVYSDTQLALWARNPKGGLCATLGSHPDVACIYGNIKDRFYVTFEPRANHHGCVATRPGIHENARHRTEVRCRPQGRRRDHRPHSGHDPVRSHGQTSPRMKAIPWAACVAYIALCGHAAGEYADTVFVGEHILTMDGATPTAVAVIEDRIAWTGSESAAKPWIGPQTQVRSLGGHALLPGFIDAHGHLSFTAQTIDMANVSAPPVGNVADIASLQHELTRYIEARTLKAGDWVVGMGYDDSLLSERRHPTRADLDAVSADLPIVLIHVSGHLMSANSAALTAVGIDANTTDPEGGHIRRRKDSNEPDGVLEETATAPLRTQLELLAGDVGAAIDKALDTYARFGITSVQDGAASMAQVNTLMALDAAGRLDLDVAAIRSRWTQTSACPRARPFGRYGKSAEARRHQAHSRWVAPGQDGVPVGALSRRPGECRSGLPGLPDPAAAAVNALVARYLGDGIQVIAHANG
ncbi:MAG: amidohydrolase family protein, partial [Gammaproteobacteria bacterium]|nr:amidohydrolase family protein [Gammaproteobacteria bacterium]